MSDLSFAHLDLPDNRIKNPEELLAFLGKKIYAVHHYTELKGDGFVGTDGVVVFPWIVGPLLHLSRSGYGRNRLTEILYEIDKVRDANPEFIYVAENGDWGNDLRDVATVISTADYGLGMSEAVSASAFFRTEREADLWAIQVRLSFTEPFTQNPNLYKKNARSQISRGIVNQAKEKVRQVLQVIEDSVTERYRRAAALTEADEAMMAPLRKIVR